MHRNHRVHSPSNSFSRNSTYVAYFLSRYSSAEETAVCNLASLNLQKFIACAQVQSSNLIAELSKTRMVHSLLPRPPDPALISILSVWCVVMTSAMLCRSVCYSFPLLQVQVTRVVTRNLNAVIDVNYYPVLPLPTNSCLRIVSASFCAFAYDSHVRFQVPSAQKSNMRHRPVGLGVQGLADVFCRLKLPFESEAAKQLNRDIFEVHRDCWLA